VCVIYFSLMARSFFDLRFAASFLAKTRRFCSRRVTLEVTFSMLSSTLSATIAFKASAFTLLYFSMISFVLALSWER